jgi:hypothetical protein
MNDGMEAFSMVAFLESGHEHGDGDVCPGCKFKAALAEHLAWAAGDSELSWHECTAEITNVMCESLAALTALRAGRFDNDVADPGSAARAAATISRLGGVIQSMWVALMDDDDDADDDPDTVP